MKTILHLGLEPPPSQENTTIVFYPVIRIVPREKSASDIVSAVAALHSYNVIVFTSKTAVDLFFALLPNDTPLTRYTWIAVGTATTRRLKEKGIHTVSTATEETAEGVVALIDALSFPRDTHFLWPHSALARRVIPAALTSRGFPLTECILYDTQLHTPSPKPSLDGIDEILFTSPSSVNGFLLAYGALPHDKILRAIGPVTAAALKNVADIRPDKDTLDTTIQQKEITMSQKFTLPPLPYALDALEPVISAEIMNLHYNKHHNAYVTNLNVALEKYAKAEGDNDLPAMIALEPAIRFNGGGNINHSIFWTNLAPINNGGGTPPAGPLADAIKAQFGSLDDFITQFNAATVGIQGSGWGWLGYNKVRNRLEIASCSNQDPLQSATGLIPLLGIDVWEHAYYLQYKNVRADYLKEIWKVVNWKNVAERYAAATAA